MNELCVYSSHLAKNYILSEQVLTDCSELLPCVEEGIISQALNFLLDRAFIQERSEKKTPFLRYKRMLCEIIVKNKNAYHGDNFKKAIQNPLFENNLIEKILSFASKAIGDSTLGEVVANIRDAANVDDLFHYAVAKQKTDLVNAFLKTTIDVNRKTIDGNTPLHMLFKHTISKAYDNENHIGKKLLDFGAEINAQNKHGNTPLMLALSRCKIDEPARFLVNNQASITIKNNQGKTAAEMPRLIMAKMSEKDLLNLKLSRLNKKEDVAKKKNTGAKENKRKKRKIVDRRNSYKMKSLEDFVKDIQTNLHRNNRYSQENQKKTFKRPFHRT